MAGNAGVVSSSGGSPLLTLHRQLSGSVSSLDDSDDKQPLDHDHDRDHDPDSHDQHDRPVSPVSRLTERALEKAETFKDSARWDAYDLSQPETVSPGMSHAPSEVSERLSTISGLTSYFPKHPLNIRPAPAYVASLGASQVVSENKASLGRRWSDEEEAAGNGARKSDAQFAEPALALVNTFLDQLLYSFLASASSTSLNALRPAVTEVLKSKLAREAIASAEEELAELLAGGDDEEEMDSRHKAAEHKREWDLELVWKRTRLRVMVYTRLGEMEDEDEERYVQEEQLFHGDERRFSQSSGLVSWASAIFLTSVIEFIAEQTLQIAGKAAYTRARRRERSQAALSTHDSPVSPTSPLYVEEYDVEKVALNSTLGRLWRTWRKAQRNSVHPSAMTMHSRNMSTTSNKRSVGSFATAHEGSVRSMHSSHPSTATVPGEFSGSQSPGPEIQYPEHVLAANIPLPIGEKRRDIDEIETPWLAKDPDAEDAVVPSNYASDGRRNTFTGLSIPSPDIGDPFLLASFAPPTDTDQRPQLRRQRSRSVGYIPGVPLAMKDDSAMPGAFPNPGQAPMRSPEEEDCRPFPDSSFSEPSGRESLVVVKDAPAEHGPTTATAVDDVQPKTNDEISGEKAEAQPEESETHGGGLFAAAGAVAAAAVGAGAVALGLATKEEDKAEEDDVPSQEPEKTSNIPEIQSHEVDERKSLADIKTFIAANPAPAHTGDVSPPSPSSRRLSAYNRDTRPLSFGSVSSIGSKDQAYQSLSQRRESAISDLDASEIQARPPSKSPSRPTRIIIGSSPPPSPGKETHDEAGDKLSSSVDNELQRPISRGLPSPNEQTRFPQRQTGLTRSNGQRKSSDDSSAAAAMALGVAGAGAPRQDVIAAQEPGSPLRQRLAGFKKTGNGAEPAVNPLTSASIRGPEDFDMFVQAVETVKYTLTPDNVRDDAERPRSRDVPMLTTTNLPKKQQLPPLDTRSAPVSGTNPDKPPQSAALPASAPVLPRTDVRRSVSRPAQQNVRSASRSGHQAREPRVQTESTRDFADFIRSTGPGKDTTVQPVLSNVSATSLHSLRAAHINGASATASAAASAAASRSGSPGPHDRAPSMNTTTRASKVPPMPPIPAQTRTGRTMQARSATASSQRNSDLIDFIRSGPEEHGQHRIPRNVAPFRTTMDSDQFQELAERESSEQRRDAAFATAGSSVMSVQSTSSARGNSARTSTNSRSALLTNNPTTTAAAAPAVQPLRNGTNMQQSDTKMRYRNKDPYSTDFVDEDDDYDDEEEFDNLGALPGREKPQESLMDFLRNSEPPSSTSPTSRSAASPTGKSTMTTPRSSSAKPARSGAATPTGPTAVSSQQNQQQQQRSYTSSMRSSSGVPAQPQQRLAPRMEARDSTAFPSRANTATSSATGRGEGRGGGAPRTATADLADFLKNSGPVEDPDSAPAPSVGKAPRLTPKEAEKARKREEKLRGKDGRRPDSGGNNASSSGGSGGGLFSGFRKKAHLEVS